MQSAKWYRDRAYSPALSVADKATIRQDWEEIKGVAFSASFNANCPNCYHDAVILILRMMEKKDNGGYVLKRGKAFKYKGKVYTNQNITPEAAEWWIKQDLKHRDDFLELGKDYDSYGRAGKSEE